MGTAPEARPKEGEMEKKDTIFVVHRHNRHMYMFVQKLIHKQPGGYALARPLTLTIERDTESRAGWW